ncbi:recombinase family protein [Chloroflexota bacterium]
MVNETEAYWVKQIFEWLVNEGLSTNAITYRLRDLKAPTKRSQHWNRSSVIQILKNPAYTGKTYAFTFYQSTNRRKPQSEWIEIPSATPAIISEELFEAAQTQLQLNHEKSKRNTKQQYLLRGHLYCRQCGYAYCGHMDRTIGYYRCPGKLRIIAPVNRCANKNWRAGKIETLIWEKIEDVLDNPDFIATAIEKKHDDAKNIGTLEPELRLLERQLGALDREQKQLLQWALKGFPEDTVVAENKRINERRSSLQSRKVALETQIQASREAAVSLPNLEEHIQLVREKLTDLDFDMKRLALDMLNVKIWVDGSNVEITGTIPVENSEVVTTSSKEIS